MVLLAAKDEAMTVIAHFRARIEAVAWNKVGTLHTNCGEEFMAKEFMEQCADEGIQRHLTAPYTPQKNGVLRHAQIMLGMATSMMKAMDVPNWLWGEAMLTTVFRLNRSPTHSVYGKTPYEAWYGTRPSVHFLWTFGCVAHVKVTGRHQAKLDNTSWVQKPIGSTTCAVGGCASHRTPCSWKNTRGTGAGTCMTRRSVDSARLVSG
jgi:hypothetical protein